MEKNIILFGLFLCVLLTSCAFLKSPFGEELIEDAAEEVIKLEHDLACDEDHEETKDA